MIDSKDTGFKSYILDDGSLESIKLNDLNHSKLLEGEHITMESQKVMMYTPLSDRKRGSLGALTVTTFKLSFISANDKEEDQFEDCCQHNLLLGPNEVCLSSIDTVYQLGERSKKKLLAGQTVSGKVKELLVICKNMRAFEFSFKFADKDSGKKIANAILRHAFPKTQSLLFAYDFKEPYYKTVKNVRMFRVVEDWRKEMQRTACKNWRISLVNQNFQMAPLLPQSFVVPASVTDGSLIQAVEHFRNRCCPIWVWGTREGAALVRMSDILPTITDRTQENIMLELVRKSHVHKRQPYIMDLTRDCPSPKDVQLSFIKLRELSIPDSIRSFKSQDHKFYGLLDSTKWLQYISICLSKTNEAVNEITSPKHTTVVLQEGNGQDMNCVISSLIQICIDPYWRTMCGFQSLIQKEWVALGHPFAVRLGHIISQDMEQSPLFLLFLDCVWQLLQQVPTAFQFTETYLTTVWDSAHVSIFDTFIFNCEHDRFMAQMGSRQVVLRSAWDWKEQFVERDIALFCNPLYDDSYKEILKPNTAIPYLEFWSQCYLRWLPDLEIQNGGKPQVDLCNRFITSQIHSLRQKLQNMDLNQSNNITKEDNLQLLKKVNSFFPFSRTNGQIGGVSSLNTSLLSGDTLDTQSILNHSSAND